RIIAKMIDKEPGKRYQSADQVLEEISRFEKSLEDETIIEPKVKTRQHGERPVPHSIRKKIIAAVLFLFIGILGVGLYNLLVTDKPKNHTEQQTEKGTLSLTTIPYDVDIYSVTRGKESLLQSKSSADPLRLSLAAGSHQLRIKKEGYQDFDSTIQVNSGKTISCKVSLEQKKITSLLAVTTDPSNAQIYLDRKVIGKSPIHGREIIPGNHTVRAELEGYPASEQSFTITDRDSSIHLKLQARIVDQGETYKGILALTTNPAEVNIFSIVKHQPIFLESKTSEAPALLALEAGLNVIRVTKEGYRQQELTVDIEAGKTLYNRVSLTPMNLLSITTEPSNARIYLDGEYLNNSPIHCLEVEAGAHTVRAERDGCVSEQSSVNIMGSTSLHINLKQIKGILELDTRPPKNVTAQIDNQNILLQASKTILELPVGNHTLDLVFIANEYTSTWTEEFIVREKEMTKMSVDFLSNVMITIASRPAPYHIFIDNVQQVNENKIPFSTPKEILLRCGNHLIEVRNPENPSILLRQRILIKGDMDKKILFFDFSQHKVEFRAQ
ncbi:MAG: PEGA domain-containing protein, partial [Calditrichaeota bacterium]